MASEPQPLPQGAVPTPAATPQVPVVQTEIPPLSGETPIQLMDQNGNPTVKTVSELAEGWRGQISPEDKEGFALYQKAFVQNDPTAIRQMYQKFMPPEAAAAPTPEAAQEQMAAMSQQITELKQLVQTNIQPTVQEINTHREVAVFGQSLKENEKTFPCTVAHPDGATLTQQRFVALQEECRRAGHDPATFTPQVRQQLAVKAAQDIEQHLRRGVQVFGGTVPGVAPAGPNITSVNDQGADPTPGVHKAPYQMGPEGYTDTRLPQGAPVQQAPLSSVPIQTPVGGAPGMVPEQSPNPQIAGRGGLSALMKQRMDMAAGTV